MEPETNETKVEETVPIDPTSMIQRTVRLNDESEYEGSAYTNSEKDLLIVNLEDIDMVTAFPIFTDSEKTKKIRSVVFNHNSHRAISDNTYEGYTWFVQIKVSGENGIAVHLRRPLPEES